MGAFLLGFLTCMMILAAIIGFALYAPQIIAKDCQEFEE